MTKSVVLYFKSENDAESARAKLQSLKVSNLFIDQMSENTETEMYIPFFPTNIDSAQTSPRAGAIGENGPLSDEIESKQSVSNEEVTHLLQFDVKEEDYEEVLIALRDVDCYYDN